jgi:hypothetical protein
MKIGVTRGGQSVQLVHMLKGDRIPCPLPEGSASAAPRSRPLVHAGVESVCLRSPFEAHHDNPPPSRPLVHTGDFTSAAPRCFLGRRRCQFSSPRCAPPPCGFELKSNHTSPLPPYPDVARPRPAAANHREQQPPLEHQ